MPTTPRARGRSSHSRARCSCLGGSNKGDRATPCCSFNPLRSLFRCPGRGRSRSRSRSKHRQRTPSKVRDAPVSSAGAQQRQTQEEEPSFFVYAMPNQCGFGATGEPKKKKHRKPRMPSFGSCFRGKKKERKQANAAATVSAPRSALTPASSLLTHPPGSPAPEKAQAVTPSVTQPPSPAPTEIGSTVNSPAPTGRQPAKRSTDSTRPTFAPQMQPPPPKQVEGLEIVEVATGERLSTHELGLIEMVGSSTDNSAESSVKSSLDYVNEPPPPAERMVVEREASAVPVKIEEVPKLWLNGKSAESRARERFAEPLVVSEAEELRAHDVACSRVHALMLAETKDGGGGAHRRVAMVDGGGGREMDSPRFRAILRATSGRQKRAPEVKSFSHELGSRGGGGGCGGVPAMRKMVRSGGLGGSTTPEEFIGAIQTKFIRLKEDVDSELGVFAGDLMDVLDSELLLRPLLATEEPGATRE